MSYIHWKMNDARFLRYVEDKVKATIRTYGLLDKGDKIIVACSGGKDSTTALYILRKLDFSVEAMHINQLLGDWTKRNLENLTKFCSENEIRLHVVHMREEYGCSVCYMKSVLDGRGVHLNSCTICGVVRRQILNKKAREIAATKVATGHNLDDEAQTITMNYIQGNMQLSAKLGPISGVKKNEDFIPRVKPLYFCLEEETRRYSKIKNFPVVYEPCPCSLDTFRTSIKKMLNRIEEKHPKTKETIVRNFLTTLPHLKREYAKKGGIRKCLTCGEPSSTGKCKVCSIIEKLRS